MAEAGLRMPKSAIVTSVEQAQRRARRGTQPGGLGPAAVRRAPRVHARRARRRDRAHRRGVRADRRARPRGLADRAGAARRVGDRLGRVRAGGDARPRRQRRDRVLDRERRPDGRAHRRLGHGRAAADAHRPPLPAAARPGDRGHPRGRRRDRRLQRAVRGQPRHRGDPRDRDEPARVALLGAGLQGDRLPDRQDRRAPGRRLPPGRDRQRHHRGHARVLRADDRLRRRQVAALRLREVPRDRSHADHAHEVGGRGDGDRAHLPAGVRQGAALARARQDAVPGGAPRRAAAGESADAGGRPLRDGARAAGQGRERRVAQRAHADRPVVPGRAARARAGPRRAVRGRALVPVGRHLRRGVPRAHPLLLLRLGAQRPRTRSGAESASRS